MTEQTKTPLKLKIFSHKKIIVALSVVTALSLIGLALAATFGGSSIFGAQNPNSATGVTPSPAPTATPTPTASPSPTPVVFAGTLSAVHWTDDVSDPATVPVGDTITLTATLSSVPSTPQSVWFYWSSHIIPVDANNNPTNADQFPGSGGDIFGINIGVSSGNSASVSYTMTAGPHYFLAVIPTPT